jgi:hypothetical protein
MAKVTLIKRLSLQIKTNIPSKTLPALVDTRRVGLTDQKERMAACGLSPAMVPPDEDASVAYG